MEGHDDSVAATMLGIMSGRKEDSVPDSRQASFACRTEASAAGSRGGTCCGSGERQRREGAGGMGAASCRLFRSVRRPPRIAGLAFTVFLIADCDAENGYIFIAVLYLTGHDESSR